MKDPAQSKEEKSILWTPSIPSTASQISVTPTGSCALNILFFGSHSPSIPPAVTFFTFFLSFSILTTKVNNTVSRSRPFANMDQGASREPVKLHGLDWRLVAFHQVVPVRALLDHEL